MDLEKRIEELLRPILEEEGLELYDVEWNPAGKHSHLRIYVDKEGGVTLKDCERISSQIGDLLDVEDLIHVRYFLEVSSPGLTRELKKPSHFQKSLGSSVKLTLKGGRVLEGSLTGADDEGFSLMASEGEIRVEYDEVAKAKLQFGQEGG
jgi:ribosome maturation factor RimP